MGHVPCIYNGLFVSDPNSCKYLQIIMTMWSSIYLCCLLSNILVYIVLAHGINIKLMKTETHVILEIWDFLPAVEYKLLSLLEYSKEHGQIIRTKRLMFMVYSTQLHTWQWWKPYYTAHDTQERDDRPLDLHHDFSKQISTSSQCETTFWKELN